MSKMLNHSWVEYVDSFADFATGEVALLDKHYDFYLSLYNEDQPAETAAQKAFVKNCHEGTPQTGHERISLRVLSFSGAGGALVSVAAITLDTGKRYRLQDGALRRERPI